MTVVMATLGGPTLPTTIESLNQGTVVPQEILVCIPEAEAPRVRHLPFSNVRVLVTSCRGQVAQRAEGFKSASHDIVMQLDDDVVLDTHCVAHLLETLSAQGKAAVAPALVDTASGASVYRRPQRNELLQKFYYWVMNGAAGYQEGKIDRAGCPVGVDPEIERKEIYEVEWLAGGCVLHRRENLVLENFYPFRGKAYCEDVMHSHHLQKKGVRLVIDARAICRLDNPPSVSHRPRDFFRDLIFDLRARRYFMAITARRSFRMYFFYVASTLSYLLKKASRPDFDRKRS